MSNGNRLNNVLLESYMLENQNRTPGCKEMLSQMLKSKLWESY